MGKTSPIQTGDDSMTATSIFIHAGFVTGLALAMLTGLVLA
ncbi:hypothetical protein [Jannaschia pohangensis]|uniref:Uncharacterized protein n=1 Tax=Jannaschia pohangensis TaxID=390807 RepID=A0A1I3LZZ1_9RHOB|nr:hypothetical protein [Jannaschia pohangensis]SFI90006.1 hypothetical protein SAMN04488095_1681 [Jannaschia pohangensis]